MVISPKGRLLPHLSIPAIYECVAFVFTHVRVNFTFEMVLQNLAPLVHRASQPQPRGIGGNDVMLFLDAPEVGIEL
ncbi:hypothetical protein GJ744_006831 [Endocarpon pusillum]|uniref:Uncharacterized protein n=1 Tax=Endocarpon pusillum TaxID=364733 RepID=A0A8H7ASH3_9EURO|nr:hypothetical protein GJ744_006831 [Endocarpon pusillum]